MTETNIITIIIFAVSLGVTIGLNHISNTRAQGRMEGIIEQRLKSGDEKFGAIDANCKEHGKQLKELEISQAHLCEKVDNHDRRLVNLEAKR